MNVLGFVAHLNLNLKLKLIQILSLSSNYPSVFICLL